MSHVAHVFSKPCEHVVREVRNFLASRHVWIMLLLSVMRCAFIAAICIGYLISDGIGTCSEPEMLANTLASCRILHPFLWMLLLGFWFLDLTLRIMHSLDPMKGLKHLRDREWNGRPEEEYDPAAVLECLSSGQCYVRYSMMLYMLAIYPSAFLLLLLSSSTSLEGIPFTELFVIFTPCSTSAIASILVGISWMRKVRHLEEVVKAETRPQIPDPRECHCNKESCKDVQKGIWDASF